MAGLVALLVAAILGASVTAGCAAKGGPAPASGSLDIMGWGIETSEDAPDQIIVTQVILRNNSNFELARNPVIGLYDGQTGERFGQLDLKCELHPGEESYLDLHEVFQVSSKTDVDFRLEYFELVPLDDGPMPNMPPMPGGMPQEMLMLAALLGIVIVTIAVAFFLGKPRA